MSERERKLREYEEFRRREKERRARADEPYRPGRMRVRIPLGCAIVAALAATAAIAALVKLLQAGMGR